MALLPGFAADRFTLGSCEHKIASGNGKGSDTAGEISAAMKVPASRLKSLAGNSISRVDVGLISRINVRELTVWVRTSLDGENLASATIARGSLGWNEIPLEKPYIIETSSPDLYIGFTYTNAGSSHPVSFTGDAGEYSCWLRTKANASWEEMTAQGALSLEAVVTGDNLPQYDLALTAASVTPDVSAPAGTYILSGKVANMAIKPVSGFTVLLSSNGEEKGSASVSLDIAPGESARFSVPCLASSTLTGDVTLTISSLADGNDADISNNSLDTRVAFARNVLVEEFTTELCPNCPEAAKNLHDVLERETDLAPYVVAVCHHAGFGEDWLTRDCDRDLLWMYDMGGQSFAPAAMFDRQPIFKRGLQMDRLEPIVALRSRDDFTECVSEALAIPAHVAVGVRIVSLTDSEATLEVNVLTDSEFDFKNPRLTLLTLEDDVKARAQQGTDESNYLHHHVIRTDNGGWGEEFALTDGTFSKIYTVALQPEWNREKLSFAAFVAERDTENVGGNIVGNAASVKLSSFSTSVKMTEGSEPAVETARYDISGRRIPRPAEGINIVVFSDGSVKKEFIPSK